LENRKTSSAQPADVVKGFNENEAISTAKEFCWSVDAQSGKVVKNLGPEDEA
jgi:hypothetical protein